MTDIGLSYIGISGIEISDIGISHVGREGSERHLGGIWEASGSWGGPGRPLAALDGKCSKFIVFYSV